ncbi:MAG: class I SAM-dependent methyltransferase [Lachnospira sp.]|nr:class I SAM-dependent methyltransferase [Lachnospira sp.]
MAHLTEAGILLFAESANYVCLCQKHECLLLSYIAILILYSNFIYLSKRKRLSSHRQACRFYAANYNKAMTACGRCRVRQCDVSDLPFAAGSFDLATAFETIYFWPGLERCFAQVEKVLKQGGYFLICNESDGMDATGRKFEDIIDGMICYTPEQIEAALKKAGFSEVTKEHHPNKPWITVLARK